MLYHVPSGSKSPVIGSVGLATGCACWNALRFAIIVQLRSGFTRMTPLGMLGTPCEQPAPAKIAYSVLPTNATSATPLANGSATLDGNPSTNVSTWPLASILEMREPVVLPKYSPGPPAPAEHTPPRPGGAPIVGGTGNPPSAT